MNTGLLRLFPLFLLMMIAGRILSESGRPKSATGQRRDVATAQLVPLLSNPMNADITVKNVGTATADPTKLTLDCIRLDVPIQMNSCPDLPPSFAVKYFDEAFPKNATIRIPALAPGEEFKHTLLFWFILKFPSGRFKFTAVADAEGKTSPPNRKSKVASRVLVVP